MPQESCRLGFAGGKLAAQSRLGRAGHAGLAAESCPVHPIPLYPQPVCHGQQMGVISFRRETVGVHLVKGCHSRTRAFWVRGWVRSVACSPLNRFKRPGLNGAALPCPHGAAGDGILLQVLAPAGSSEALVGIFTCSAVVLMVVMVKVGAALMPTYSGSFSRLFPKIKWDLEFCTAVCSGHGSRG